MGKILLIILFITTGLLYSENFEESLNEIDFSGVAVRYEPSNNSYIYFPDKEEGKKEVALGKITESINSIFTLWLTENTSLNLESDVRFQYPLISNLPNEITIHDLLMHSSGINETSIHSGNSQAFYPSLKYDQQGINYSLLRSIIELQGINYEEYFNQFLKDLNVSNIGFINNPSNYNIAEKNYLKGSSDLYGSTEDLTKLFSKVALGEILNNENREILTKINFKLEDSTNKTLLGDKYKSSSGNSFYLINGNIEGKNTLVVVSDTNGTSYFFQSGPEEDLYKVFEYYYNSGGNDKIELPETIEKTSLIIFTLPLILLAILIYLLVRKKK